MRQRFLTLGYLQCDETPIDALDFDNRVKDEKGRESRKGRKKQIRRCYAWAYGVPQGEVIYDITPSRSGSAPRKFLVGFEGYLQTDGYVGYDTLFEARPEDPRGVSGAREKKVLRRA